MRSEALGEPALADAASPIRLKTRLERLGRRLFSFPAVLIAGLVVVTVFSVSNRFNDPDLWWQLKVGEIIATTHSIPSTDLFSFTAHGRPWTAHEWLAQLSIYAAYAAGGDRGLMIWLCVFASLVFVLVYALSWLYSRDPLISFFGGMIAWFFATVGLAIRPMMLGHLFLIIEMVVLELGRTKHRRWLWWLPPLFAVWANCHGSYVFGLAVLAVYWICSRLDRQWGLIAAPREWDKEGRNGLGVIILLCVAALCCNPVGVRLLVYPFDTLFRLSQQSASVRVVDEWMPASVNDPRAIGVIATVVAIFLFSLLRRSALCVRELLLVFMAFGLALRHARMLFLFGIVVSPIVCRLLASIWRKDTEREHPVANAAMVLACLAAIVWAFPSAAALQEQRKTSPVAAVDYIRRQGLSGPILNEYEFGGYLIWALPEHKVFIDGRADVYDWVGVFAEYGRWATLADDPKALLDKYNIRLCLLRKTAAMSAVMPYLPGWRKVYSDNLAEVFVR